MTKFKELSKEKVSVFENDLSNYWDKIDVLNKSINNRSKDNNFVFYDGPATANAMPKLHHMLAKLLKDTFCKYKTMQGYRVLRKVGWDTHGLPVELEVEKELSFSNKTDIEKYGIEKFNKKCRESVWKNEKAFSLLTKRMGQFIDLENPYVTYENNYIETEWWILDKMFKEGVIYEGHKIMPLCPRCGTALASHEVAQGYKNITVDTVIAPFKLKNEDTYFLVWTTTPWTLIANVALCVNPQEKYIKVKSQGYQFILAESLANSVLGSEYEVIDNYLGKDLEMIEYEPLLPFLKVDKKAYFVTCDNYVTMEDGTGIVHIAPAFGADDAEVGRKYNLPTLNPVDEEGKYREGPWTGLFVMDADLEIIKYLKANDKLFKKQKMEHNYPHCWRCQTPLIYYPKPGWFIETTKIKDKLIANNQKVNWFPSYVGEKRLGNWLDNLNDWALGRNRYWGTPLNIWKCECGELRTIGSKQELINKAIEKIDETIDLHRPYVDNVHITCPKCHKSMTRIEEVADCWFDSGSMPFAQYHYPFENQELFNEQFPADFISEGIDQTRGWFYVLLVISTFVKGVSPYKNVLVNDMVLDKEGLKMSKSRNNGIDPFELMDQFGADAIRWYFPSVSPVWTPTKFDIEGLKEVNFKFFSTLKNTYNFFTLYANTDQIDPREFEVANSDREEIDRWLLSKYNKLVKNVTEYYDIYDLTQVVREIQYFVLEDLSNWYIRRNRKRFWGNELDLSKKSVYKTTYEVLEGISRLIAPLVPFISEEIYRNLTEKESVHLADFPKADLTLIDEKIEERMDLVRELISLGRAGRESVKIKVRQPLSEIIIDGRCETIISDLIPLIKEELNVKTVVFTNDLNLYMNFNIVPNYKIAGPIFGAKIKGLVKALSELNLDQINNLNNNKPITLKVNDLEKEIDSTMIETKIISKEGFNASMENNKFVILNTKLTSELIQEGIARELISKIQQLRKANDYNIIDRINIYYNGDAEVDQAIKSFEDFIKNETLSLNIIRQDDLDEVFDINGYDVYLKTEKKQG